MNHFGESAGGFCCGGALKPGGMGCSTPKQICALSARAMLQGHKRCRSWFYWANPNGMKPDGYVQCGPAGWARDAQKCQTVILNMTAASAGFAFPAAGKARKLAKLRQLRKVGPQGLKVVKDAGRVMAVLGPILAKLATVLAKSKPARWAKNISTFGKDLKKMREVRKLLLRLRGSKAGAAIYWGASGPVHPADLLRFLAQAAAVLDPTGIADVVAAFSWPMWGDRPH